MTTQLRPSGWRRWFPGVAALHRYRRADLRHDLVAGAVITAFLIPVGMAYAQASGIAPVYGLYATVVPLLVYAAMGPSRVLMLGPDSTLAPLIALTILPLAAGDAGRAVALAGALAIVSGLLCAAAGLARFGFVTELLSMPVRYGYLAGVATVVIAGQLPSMLGISVTAETTTGRFIATVRAIAGGEAVPEAVALGAASLAGIIVLRRLRPGVPGVLVVVLGALVAVALADLDGRVGVVGPMPGGLPAPALPAIAWTDLGPLLAGAATVAVVSITDTSLLSRSFAARQGRRVDPDQELVALGAANIAAGLTQGFAVSASSSRTPVAITAGARTQLTGVVAAGLVATLLVAAPGALRLLPTATLAAVVIAAVIELYDVRAARRLLRHHPGEFAISLVALVGVVVLGVLWGIGLAVLISLLSLVQRAWRPYSTTLVRVHGDKGYHDVARHPDGRQVPGLVLFRFDAPLFFANAELFRERVLDQAAEAQARWIVITAEPITDIDATADQMLADLHRELAEQRVVLAFAELKGVVRDTIEGSGTAGVIGADRFYRTVGQAVRAYVDATGIDWVDWEDQPAG